jgi:hypothetical protein
MGIFSSTDYKDSADPFKNGKSEDQPAAALEWCTFQKRTLREPNLPDLWNPCNLWKKKSLFCGSSREAEERIGGALGQFGDCFETRIPQSGDMLGH